MRPRLLWIAPGRRPALWTGPAWGRGLWERAVAAPGHTTAGQQPQPGATI
ncbi:hypothetical protein HMPREF1317_2383 [Schaalia georgiae F0490]|uniref:Uncharacterized protein n=1 Tax=Schaalia georgiae F0490 TaxID=1125717 RepID=J0XEP4_9ACTO|nr:hypothetical protein HMPREF1317_2383 [Schaalia georgiae F0490]